MADALPRLLLSTERYAFMAPRIAAHDGFEEGAVETRRFPDGERYRRVLAEVAGRDVVLVGGTTSEVDTLDLYDLACTLASDGARSLIVVVPFLGYSTMERAVKPGEVVAARTRAWLLSTIPAPPGGLRLVLLDLHTTGELNYFAPHLRPVHLTATPVLLDRIRAFGGDDFVVASADAGGVKHVEALARALGVETAFVFKRRIDARHTEVTSVAARVEGRRVVIYDDMVRTGASLLGAAKAYRDAGAVHVSAVVTHGVLPNDTLARLEQDAALDALGCTDSHPRAAELSGTTPFLHVDSVASLLARGLSALGRA